MDMLDELHLTEEALAPATVTASAEAALSSAQVAHEVLEAIITDSISEGFASHDSDQMV
jgi:hypothetical protein